MSSFGIESAGKWLGQLLVQEVQQLAQVSDKVGELQSELEWMQCFLLDADVKQMKNALIRKWVSEISGLALEAEDLTETYILKVSHKRQDGVLNIVKWLACFWMDGRTLHVVGSQIDGLTSKISKMSARLQTYGVRSSYEVGSSHMEKAKKLLAEQRRTYSHSQSQYIVGLDGGVAKFTAQLEEGSQKIAVAHGMGGIGKTALAREVHQKCLSQGHFVGCAWAYVSQQFNLETICKELLNELIQDDKEKDKINRLEASQLPGTLCEILTKNNYLVVLDDVWTVRDWKCLEPAFPIHEPSCGSRILVTTRNPLIFSGLGVDLVWTWKAETLKEDSCWQLLENKGHFNRKDLESSMEEVAKKMLDHCNGHPLAILALGGVLASKKTLEEWVSVCENLQTHLQGDDESYIGVYDVLAMSYNDLHYALKPCFLHMAHFPEDFHISVEKVYNLWIADGIVSSTQDQSRKKISLEEIADDYLNQLIQKGMVQVNDKDADGRIATCSLHDLMRDKCLEMAREESFVQIMNTDDDEEQRMAYSTDGKARRVTIYVGEGKDGESILDLLSGTTTSLRSLLFISMYIDQERTEDGWDWVKTICKRFRLLRVLDFEGGLVLQGTLPKEIGRLIYLRHLCLKGTFVTALPRSIRNLKCLLILDLRVNGVVITVPNVLWEMKSLCCLYFAERILSQEQDHTDGNTQGYKIEGDEFLILDKLSRLEMVSNVDLENVDVAGLLQLTGMRKLSATCKTHKESLVPFLMSPSIKHLNLRIDAGLLTGKEYSDIMLLSESNSLRILHIDAIRDETYLPIRVDMFPCNLVELGFWYCLFEEDPMPVLEKLPKLRNLQLHICYDGDEISCSDEAFPELTYLALDGLFSLERWNVEQGGFPKLEKIEIYNCPLDEIPEFLPPNIEIGCLEDFQDVVDAFRQQNA